MRCSGAVEQGVVTLIGATTENPSFEVIPALLSRCQVYALEALAGRYAARHRAPGAGRGRAAVRRYRWTWWKTTPCWPSAAATPASCSGLLELVVQSTPPDPANGRVQLTDDAVQRSSPSAHWPATTRAARCTTT
ncbi:MAG: hypothetical protein WKG07_42805 [Hymenobacter sp.]